MKIIKRLLIEYLIMILLGSIIGWQLGILTRPIQPKPCPDIAVEIDSAWRTGNDWGFAAGYQACKKGEHAP